MNQRYKVISVLLVTACSELPGEVQPETRLVREVNGVPALAAALSEAADGLSIKSAAPAARSRSAFLLRRLSAQLEEEQRRTVSLLRENGLLDRAATFSADRSAMQRNIRSLLAQLESPDRNTDRLALELRGALKQGSSVHGVEHGRPVVPFASPRSRFDAIVQGGSGFDLPPPQETTCTPASTDPLCAPASAVPFTPALQAKAAALGNDPVRIYRYVQERIAFDTYRSINKSPDAVMETGRGGEAEQLLLLGTLLRIAGYPVQYVRDWVYAPQADVQRWLGQKNPIATDRLVSSLNLGLSVTDGHGDIVGYQMWMSWVEAYLGERWVPLMPYYAKTEVLPGIAHPTRQVPFDEAAFLSKVRADLASEVYARSLTSSQSTNLADLPTRVVQLEEAVGTLPDTLPVTVLPWGATERMNNLPVEKFLLGEVVVSSEHGALSFSHTVNLSLEGYERITLTWRAASTADLAVINSYGGLSNVPAGAVSLVPVLRVGGAQVAVGNAMLWGSKFQLKMQYWLYGHSFAMREKPKTVGSIFNLGFNARQFSQAFLDRCEAEVLASAQVWRGSPPTAHDEAFTGQLLFCAGVKYFLDNEASAQRLAGFHQYRYLRFPQHATTSATVDVWYLFDRPYLVVPGGAVLDAWWMGRGLHDLEDDPSTFDSFAVALSYDSSALEHMLWEYYLGVESVSTTKLHQVARVNGVPILEFAGFTPAATIRQALNLDPWTEDYIIEDCTIEGARVKANRDTLQVNDWSGAAWTADRGGGAIAMMISGGLSSASANGNDSGHLDRDLVTQLRKLRATDTGRAHGGAASEQTPVPKEEANEKESGSSENNFGDPVNLASGNLFRQEIDLRLRSPGYPLLFERFYNSHLPHQGPLGNGWTHTYHSALHTTSNPLELMLLDESGSVQLFTEITPGSGQYRGPIGIVATIQHVPPHHEHRTKHGFVRLYDDTTGRLESMEDRNGNRRLLSYNTDGRLVSVSDQLANTLTFTHDLDGHIASVADQSGRTWRYSYDSAGNLTRARSPSDAATITATTTYGYDNGKLIRVTDAEGGVMTVSYYEDGKVRRQEVADGRVYQFHYDSLLRRETRLTDPAGEVWRYRFNEPGDMVTRQQPDGAIWRFAYDADRNLIARTDPLGGTQSFTHDSAGNLLTRTTPLGRTSTVNYEPAFSRVEAISDDLGTSYSATFDGHGNRLTKMDANGETTFSYNGRGQITSVTDAEGHSRTLTYDPLGRLESVTDERGKVTSFGYDGLGRMTQQLRPGGVLTFTYDAMDRLLSWQEGAVEQLARVYDKNGRVVQQTNAVGATSHLQRGSGGFIEQILLPDGAERSLVYDERKKITAIVEPTGATKMLAYDALGNLIALSDSAGYTVELFRDRLGRVERSIDPMGRTTSNAYDLDGRRVRTTHPDGTFVSATYDTRGRVLSLRDRGGASTSFGYDGAGNLIRVSNALNQTTTYLRNRLGAITEITDPLGNTTTLTYDPAGNVSTREDARGILSTFVYDDHNHRTSRVITDAQGSVLDTVDTTFDHRGRLLTASDEDSSLTLSYDAAKRLVAANTGTTSVQPSVQVSYSYDLRDSVISRTGPTGLVTTLGRDAAGQLTELDDPEAGTFLFRHNRRGFLASVTYPNGATVGSVRNGAGQLIARLHKQGSTDLGSQFYLFDDARNLAQRSTTAGTDVFSYDENRRLTSVLYGSGGSELYTYDDLGGWLSSPRSSIYQYDGAHRLLFDGTYDYRYDAAGNRIEKRERASPDKYVSYTYDYDNRLAQVTEVAAGLSSVSTYAHDALGRRIATTSGGVTRRFVYDGLQVAAEYDENNQLVARYLHGPGVDRMLAIVRGGSSYFYHQDIVGSVTHISDASARVVQRYRYEPFGHRTFTADPAFVQPYGFAGRELDATGLIDMRFRTYDPAVGRFLQPDPIGFLGGMDLYGYAGGNPTLFRDPFGLAKDEEISGKVDPFMYYMSLGEACQMAGTCGGTTHTETAYELQDQVLMEFINAAMVEAEATLLESTDHMALINAFLRYLELNNAADLPQEIRDKLDAVVVGKDIDPDQKDEQVGSVSIKEDDEVGKPPVAKPTRCTSTWIHHFDNHE